MPIYINYPHFVIVLPYADARELLFHLPKRFLPAIAGLSDAAVRLFSDRPVSFLENEHKKRPPKRSRFLLPIPARMRRYRADNIFLFGQ